MIKRYAAKGGWRHTAITTARATTAAASCGSGTSSAGGAVAQPMISATSMARGRDAGHVVLAEAARGSGIAGSPPAFQAPPTAP